jgi:hypothetical protein
MGLRVPTCLRPTTHTLPGPIPDTDLLLHCHLYFHHNPELLLILLEGLAEYGRLSPLRGSLFQFCTFLHYYQMMRSFFTTPRNGEVAEYG